MKIRDVTCDPVIITRDTALIRDHKLRKIYSNKLRILLILVKIESNFIFKKLQKALKNTYDFYSIYMKKIYNRFEIE